MSNQVFWDTSALIALRNRRDENHQQAVIISKRLAQAKTNIITTSAVLTELANGFSKVNLRPVAQQMIEMIRTMEEDGMATIIPVTPELWERGWQLYVARPDKEWGLTDCISMVVMQEQQIEDVFTADHHFEQAGFRCLLR